MPNDKHLDDKLLIDPRFWWFTVDEQSELVELLKDIDDRNPESTSLGDWWTEASRHAGKRLPELLAKGTNTRGTLRPEEVASACGLLEGEVFRLILRGELTPIFVENDYGKWVHVYEDECRRWVHENRIDFLAPSISNRPIRTGVDSPPPNDLWS